MNKWLVLTTVFFICSTSFAQKIKVRRVKGQQAVVEFSGAALKPGQVYELTQDEYSEDSFSSGNQRRYLVAAQFSLLNSKSDAANAVSETDLMFSGRFGWNFAHFEAGPILTYNSEATGDVTVNTLKFGGFADYNVIANVPGEPFLYGLGGQLSFGQISGGNNSLSLMDLFFGPFVKWFPAGQNVGFRIDGGYLYQKQSGGPNDVTVTGLIVSAGILAYF